FTADERPLIAQIWGKEPKNFRKTAEQLADGTFARELGLPEGVNFAGVDLNMGCPEKSAVKNGCCVALVNDRPLAHEIIEATREGLAGRLPLSVKTRLGFNEIDLTWLEFLLGHDLAALAIHGRTRKEMSKVPAHWDSIGQAKELRDKLAPNTLLIGNGDVVNRKHGEQLAEQHGLDGIMIGRGIFHDPFAFSQNSQWESFTPAQRFELYEKHVKLYEQTWNGDGPHIQTLNKFCKTYINGFDGAKEAREQLMSATSTTELTDFLNRLA
ncbi:MAG TPA: tRNA-dihydrouridine synthase, partial [Candidatus Saccharimonadia bacterium]|nr:tRNA-dihydrouridine synthase [Candidatus Saccharimonadia bacterium]